jgi:hypothetical protein
MYALGRHGMGREEELHAFFTSVLDESCWLDSSASINPEEVWAMRRRDFLPLKGTELNYTVTRAILPHVSLYDGR